MEVVPEELPRSEAEGKLQALGLPLYRPTWRMVRGDCTLSLALQVAADFGVPERVIARAAWLQQHMQQAPGGQVSLAGAAVAAEGLQAGAGAGDEVEAAARQVDSGASVGRMSSSSSSSRRWLIPPSASSLQVGYWRLLPGSS